MAGADNVTSTPEELTAVESVFLLDAAKVCDSTGTLENRMKREPALYRLFVRRGDAESAVEPVDAEWLYQHRGGPQLDYGRSRVFCLFWAPGQPTPRWQWADIRFRRSVLAPPEPASEPAQRAEATAPTLECKADPVEVAMTEPQLEIKRRRGRPRGSVQYDDSSAHRRYDELIDQGKPPKIAKEEAMMLMKGGIEPESKTRRFHRRRAADNNSSD